VIPQGLTADVDPCHLAQRWGLTLTLAERILQGSANAGDLGLTIISGERTCAQQEALGRAGRPAASCKLSTHVVSKSGPCGATGADLWTTPTPVTAVKHRFAAAMTFAGLRVGGGSPVDPRTGLFSDWNHVDLGPKLTN